MSSEIKSRIFNLCNIFKIRLLEKNNKVTFQINRFGDLPVPNLDPTRPQDSRNPGGGDDDPWFCGVLGGTEEDGLLRPPRPGRRGVDYHNR